MSIYGPLPLQPHPGLQAEWPTTVSDVGQDANPNFTTYELCDFELSLSAYRLFNLENGAGVKTPRSKRTGPGPQSSCITEAEPPHHGKEDCQEASQGSGMKGSGR